MKSLKSLGARKIMSALMLALLLAAALLTLSSQVEESATLPSSYLFYEGFEDINDFSRWTGTEPWDGEKYSYWNWTIADSTVFEGTHAAQAAWSGDWQWGGYYVDVPFEEQGVPEAYWRVFVRFADFPVEGHDHTFLWIVAKGPPPWATRNPCGDHLGAGIRFQNGMTWLYVRRYHPEQKYFMVPYEFKLNQWHCFELGVRRATDGWHRVWVDGQMIFNEEIDNSVAPEMGAATIISSSVIYNSYPSLAWYDECAADNSYIGHSELATGRLTVDSTPISAECYVNGSNWGLTPQTRNVTAGIYEVTWASVAGYYSPSAQIVSVNESDIITVVGEYEEIPATGPFKLSVWSNPVQDVAISISNFTHEITTQTGSAIYLTGGTYNVSTTQDITITFESWTFDSWSDGLGTVTREINLTSDTTLLCNYIKVTG